MLAKSVITAMERLINVRRALLGARFVAVLLFAQRAIFHHLQELWEAFALVNLVISTMAFTPNVKRVFFLALLAQI